jgi:hypothetical protein
MEFQMESDPIIRTESDPIIRTESDPIIRTESDPIFFTNWSLTPISRSSQMESDPIRAIRGGITAPEIL